jgi:hypothetical protein
VYASKNVIRVIKLRTIRWAGHMALTEREKMHTKCRSENEKGRGYSEDPDIDGKIIFEWILGK